MRLTDRHRRAVDPSSADAEVGVGGEEGRDVYATAGITRCLQTFHAGTPLHAAVLVGVAGGSAAMAAAGRVARRRGPATARRVDRAWAVACLSLWLALTARDLTPGRINWERSIPLHVCDVVGLTVPIALALRWRAARAVVYFWGLGVSSIAFVVPALNVGPAHADFWWYWACHGAIVGGAVYDLAARRYRPTWRDWRSAVAAVFVYLPVAFLVDGRLGVNYGYVGPDMANQRSLISAFGRWPARVPRIAATGIAVMAALAVAWPRNRPRRPAVAATVGPLLRLVPTAERDGLRSAA